MTTSAARPRLLVAEDEHLVRAALVRMLVGAGYDVTATVDGEEAWRAMCTEGEAFEAILLDALMPRMDGLTLLQKIKAVPRFKRVPVIMQTALTTPDAVVAGLRAGAYYYVTKPYTLAVLLAIVAAAVADHGRHLELREEAATVRAASPLLVDGTFELRTLPEARSLATLLATAYPDPERVVIGLTELLVNAVEHGNLGISYAEKTSLLDQGDLQREIERRGSLPELSGRRARVQFSRDARSITTAIEDEGEGFDWRPYLDYDPERAFDPNGRGITIARTLSFDDLVYEGRGNRVVATVWSHPEQEVADRGEILECCAAE